MGIITLTTDMGTKDHYVASIKGRIYGMTPDVNIVDISHEIYPFKVAQAAFEVRSCIEDFPKGTIHIVGVDSEPVINFGNDEGSFPTILHYKEQYIIANDNGFFDAFLKEDSNYQLWRVEDVLSNPKAFKFPTKNIFVRIATDLISGKKLADIAIEVKHYKKVLHHIPTEELNLIKGHVIHIDNYGNAITNISKELFEKNGTNIPFMIFFRGKKHYIDEISNTYNEVPPGYKVAFFNENGLLEIAINRGARKGAGGAKELFGIQLGDVIRIEFTPKGSRETIESLFE